MLRNRFLAGLLALTLAACSLSPAVPALTPTPAISPTLPPGVTATPTSLPADTPTPTPTAEVRLEVGDHEFFNGDYVRAQVEYQQALTNATDPATRAAALWGLGRVEYAGGNYGKALEDLWNLANSFPNSENAIQAYFLMGRIYMTLERYTEAAQAFTVYLALRPQVLDAFAQELRADAYAASGNHPEAIAAYEVALNAPHIGDNTDIQVKIARAYANMGDTTTALSKYDALFEATSDDYLRAQLDLLRGQIYLNKGQSDLAYPFFLHAVENYPLSFDSYSALVTLVNAGVPVSDLDRGLVDYYASQYGYALDAFKRYMTAGLDEDGTALYYHALTLLKLGSYQEGVDELTLFISDFPTNTNWHSAWGEKADNQWFELDQYDEAAQTLLDYAAASPDIMFAPQALVTAGRIYERSGRLADAAAIWERIADDFPGSELVPQALFQAGIAHVRAGNGNGALLAFQRGLIFSQTIEEQARAQFWIGKVQNSLGDTSAAQAAWQQAAALDATDYYSLRAQDMLHNKPPFDPSSIINLNVDFAVERAEAESWMRVTFNLPAGTDLSAPGELLQDGRLIRGTELWSMGFMDEARLEFEDLRFAVENDPAQCYRLANYLLDLGLYRPAIFATRQVLSLAGQNTQSQTLAAPRYFNHIRYGLYYQDIIEPAAKQNNFDVLFLYAIVRQESLFEGFVRSSAGARGLMQIVPSTGEEIAKNLGWPVNFTPDHLYRPLVSVTLGANYLKLNRNRLEGDLYATLASYNAGVSSANAWLALSGSDQDLFLEVIRFPETSNYIRSIYENYSMYRLLYGLVP